MTVVLSWTIPNDGPQAALFFPGGHRHARGRYRPAGRRRLAVRVMKYIETTERPGTCPTPCDDDCGAVCHEIHKPAARRAHLVVTCLPEPVYDVLTLDQIQGFYAEAVDAEEGGRPGPHCPACGEKVELFVNRPVLMDPKLYARPPHRNSATLMPCGCTY